MPELPELHLPPNAITNAKQSLRWFLERGHCPPGTTEVCGPCAAMVAEAVALGLVGGGGYQIGRDGRIYQPVGHTVAERIVVRNQRPGVTAVLSDPYERLEDQASPPPEKAGA